MNDTLPTVDTASSDSSDRTWAASAHLAALVAAERERRNGMRRHVACKWVRQDREALRLGVAGPFVFKACLSWSETLPSAHHHWRDGLFQFRQGKGT